MKRAIVLISAGISLAGLCISLGVPSRVRLVYNPSDSAPRGWYRIAPAELLQVGRMVLVRPPAPVAALAAQRGYLPAGIPLLKPIAALPPQRVCIDATSVRIDGVAVATVLRSDGHGPPMPAWRHCRRLVGGEVFLLSTTHPASFDSRYFGPVAASDVMGRAQPLWTWRVP